MKCLQSYKYFSIFLFHLVIVITTAPANAQNQSMVITSDSTYTIAFLLPFNASKVFIRDLDHGDFYFPDESQIAVEYYQGALLGADSLRKRGMNITITAYDIGNDSATVNAVLANPQVKSSNLIVGPINGYALKAVSEFSLREHIPMVSPLSATLIPADPNQFYIVANATMRTHCEQIYEYLLQHELTHHTVLLYRNKSEDLELLKYFSDYHLKRLNNESTALRFSELNDSSRKNHVRLKDSLFMTDKNILVVLSNNENFVRSVFRQAGSLKADYDIQVIGMPTWLNFDLVSNESLDSTNVIITSSYFPDKSSAKAGTFKKSYVEKYKVNPSEYSIRGYDEMFYFGSHLMDMGNRLFLSVFPPAAGISGATSYKVVPVMQLEREVMYRENKSVFFLHRENGKWTKMN